MRIKNDDLIKMCVLGTLPEGVSIIGVAKALLKKGMLNPETCGLLSDAASKRGDDSLMPFALPAVREIFKGAGGKRLKLMDLVKLIPSGRPNQEEHARHIFQILNHLSGEGYLVHDQIDMTWKLN
jgi:hypothetical protein